MSSAARILVVEDDLLIAEELCDRLTRMGMQVDGPITDGQKAIRRAVTTPPDLILMDIHLGHGMDGVETARLIRQKCDVPVVFLTAYSDDVTVGRAKETGPFGYLLKPIAEPELKITIEVALQRHVLERQARAAGELREQMLRDEASRDPLTGLWNRRQIVRTLHEEIARAVREQTSIAALMIDLDRLKEINDTHGHAAGDAVICETARRMTDVVRRYDALGRYGGDEFLLIAPGIGIRAAHQLGMKLTRAVAGTPIAVGRDRVSVAISVGAYATTPDGTADPWAIVEAADQALVSAKRGRGDIPARLAALDSPLQRRIRAEFLDMPGLCVTLLQAQRLWDLSEPECTGILRQLVDAGFLSQTISGGFFRK